ncbi:MAG: hypothetical protein WA860_01475 [Acidimicrobiales bacterium]
MGAVGRGVYGHEIAALGPGAALSPATAARLAAAHSIAGLWSRGLDGRLDVATWRCAVRDIAIIAPVTIISVPLARSTTAAATATTLTRCGGSGGSRYSGSGASVAYLWGWTGITNSWIRR